ncbi:MAG: PaaI family thioesterase [Alphaproteobacteria bacterium]|nr:PaaI family thioesterase [Alphaproteobacteria bacterium]
MAVRNPFTNFGVVPREEATRRTGIEFLQDLIARRVPAAPISETAGFWLVEAEPGRAVFEGEATARFLNPLGTVHGGWISTLLDSAMGCAVHTLIKAGQSYTTAELKVNFVRPLLPGGGVLRCTGTVIHGGSRLATAEGRLVDAGGKLLAHGSTTCMILSGDRP